jgi:hypothetical protein
MAGAEDRAPGTGEQRAETPQWPRVEMVRCRDVGDLLHGHRCGYAGTNEIACPNHIPCSGETYVPLSDPASVIAALLAEHPDATIAALEALLTSDEVIVASATAVAAEYYGGWGRGFTATESASAALAAACRSLRPNTPKEDEDCPRCNGSGSIEVPAHGSWEEWGTIYAECARCRGLGRIAPKEDGDA